MLVLSAPACRSEGYPELAVLAWQPPRGSAPCAAPGFCRLLGVFQNPRTGTQFPKGEGGWVKLKTGCSLSQLSTKSEPFHNRSFSISFSGESRSKDLFNLAEIQGSSSTTSRLSSAPRIRFNHLFSLHSLPSFSVRLMLAMVLDCFLRHSFSNHVMHSCHL